MAITLMHAKNSAILQSHPLLSFGFGQYRYKITTDASANIYSVTDGASNLEATLSWAFGSGSVGQSYLFDKPGGEIYEARVSYFGSIKALEFTPGRALSSPDGLEQAADRWVSPNETYKCFSCHATGSSVGGKFDESHMILGVTCEACHGPGKKHVELMKMAIAKRNGAGRNAAAIFGALNLSPNDAADFCGACHGSYWDVALMATTDGVQTSRFQPFRLEQSKCWGNEGDGRLTCIGCHDPHKQLETDLQTYDPVCLKCHHGSNDQRGVIKEGHSCPVNSRNCVSCHMPNVYVPDMHRSFRDHRIQIVRATD